jgi:hypothetical protein
VAGKCEEIAMEIDSGFWTYFEQKFDDAYRKKFFSVLSNLKNPENQELRLKLLTKRINPMELVFMSSEELAPSKKKAMVEQQRNHYF